MKGARTILLVAAAQTAFSDHTRFPANFIADQATADQAAGSAAMHYNFCRIHKTLRVTQAMAAGVTERLWEIGDMVKVLEDWENTT